MLSCERTQCSTGFFSASLKSETSDPRGCENSDGVTGPCPNCDHGVLAIIVLNNDEALLVCVRCGFEPDENLNRECSRCGNIYWNEDGSPMCDECWTSVMEQN